MTLKHYDLTIRIDRALNKVPPYVYTSLTAVELEELLITIEDLDYEPTKLKVPTAVTRSLFHKIARFLPAHKYYSRPERVPHADFI